MNTKQIITIVTVCIALASSACAENKQEQTQVDSDLASRFARLALDCIHREYPNKIGHVLNEAADARTPSSLHPVFYGCFDWHSSVHGHWLLVRLLRTAPAEEMPPGMKSEIIAALNQSFTAAGVAEEVIYFQTENRKSYERPYGVAWFLQLTAELREWQDPQAEAWLEILLPLEAVIVAQLKAWLPNLAYAIRTRQIARKVLGFMMAPGNSD